MLLFKNRLIPSAARLFAVIALSCALISPALSQQLNPNLRGKDDRYYDNSLLRLSELLGAIHYLRELCGANEGQIWRNQMQALIEAEGTNAVRRSKLTNNFNKGYRGYRRTYRSCTQSAKVALNKFMQESTTLSQTILNKPQ